MNNKIISGDGVRVAQPLFPVEGQGSIPMSPLQLNITTISLKLAKQLNMLWHSILPEYKTGFLDTSMICFAAEYKNIYYASAIWHNSSSPAYAKKDWLELRRMAIAPEAPKNTASRMLKIMTVIIKKEFLKITKLISYQDTGVHYGTIYKASGWTAEHESQNGKLKQLKTGEYRDKPTNLISYPKIRWEKQIRPESKQATPAKRIGKENNQMKLFTL